jgi:hypothetical protein
MADEEVKESILLDEQTIEDNTGIEKEPLIVEEEAPVVVDEKEEVAKSKGWKPREEFEGDPKDWRDAKTFLEKGELLDAIKALKKSDKENREMIEKLNKHNQAIEELSFKKALAALKEEQRAAVEVGNVERAAELTDKIVEMSVPLVAKPKGPEQPVELTEFLERNKGWFNNSTPENAAMSAYATQLESHIVKQDPSLSPRDVLMRVEASVRTKFPSKFRSSERAAPAVLAAKPVATRASTSLDGLSEFHKDFIHTMKRRYSNFDVAGYVKQIRSLEEDKR